MVRYSNNGLFNCWIISKCHALLLWITHPYHSILTETYPKSNWKKADVQQWLKDKYIEYHPLETLPELRQKIKNLLSREKKYELDEIAFEKSNEVICLPPYHNQYKPVRIDLGSS